MADQKAGEGDQVKAKRYGWLANGINIAGIIVTAIVVTVFALLNSHKQIKLYSG